MSKFMSEQERENYLNESKAPQLYGITFTLLGVTVIVVLLRSVLRNYLHSHVFCRKLMQEGCRLYCRLRIVKKMQNSDYLIMVSMVSFISPKASGNTSGGGSINLIETTTFRCSLFPCLG